MCQFVLHIIFHTSRVFMPTGENPLFSTWINFRIESDIVFQVKETLNVFPYRYHLTPVKLKIMLITYLFRSPKQLNFVNSLFVFF